MLFRLQKYKKFESNSHQVRQQPHRLPVVSTAKVQKIWEQFTPAFQDIRKEWELFRLQKYKKFESNSHRLCVCVCAVSVVSTAKVQKIWEQFTPQTKERLKMKLLFRLQKYKKFESNSHRLSRLRMPERVVSTAKVQKIWEQFTPSAGASALSQGCFDCKSTKNLRAIHNPNACRPNT